jgi:hypothetical protein
MVAKAVIADKPEYRSLFIGASFLYMRPGYAGSFVLTISHPTALKYVGYFMQ